MATRHAPPRTVLCAVDFSPASDRAAAYAYALCRCLDAKLVLVHVVHSVVDYSDALAQSVAASTGHALGSPRTLAAVWSGAAKERLKTMGEPLGASEDQRRVVVGPLVSSILETAAEVEADMIVVGARGRGFVDRFLLGSTAERVVRVAPVPVTVVPDRRKAPDDLVMPPRRILCGVGAAKTARFPASWGTALARRLAADIELLHVVPAPPPMLVEITENLDPGDLAHRAAQDARDWLVHLEEVLDYEGLSGGLTDGDAAEELLATARDDGVDMIVVGARTRHGLAGLLLGNTAMRVVRHADVPVTVVRWKTARGE